MKYFFLLIFSLTIFAQQKLYIDNQLKNFHNLPPGFQKIWQETVNIDLIVGDKILSENNVSIYLPGSFDAHIKNHQRFMKATYLGAGIYSYTHILKK